MRKVVVILPLLLVCLVGAAPAADDTKLTVDELIAKHLASVGTPEARTAHQACGIEAAARFAVTMGGAGQGDGTLRMASEGRKLRMVMKFNTPNYMGEDFTNDGSKVNVAIRVSGKPSLLSQFFQNRIDLLKEGLFGGALTSGWLLFEPKAPLSRIKYNGLKKIEGRELHELQYETRNDVGDVRVRIYLEPETYRHLLTTYEATMKAQSSSTTSGRGRSLPSMASQESRTVLKERFDDFKTVDSLTVPTTWTIKLSGDMTGGTELQWSVSVQDMIHGEIDAATFKTK